MSFVDSEGNPVAPQISQEDITQVLTGFRIRIDAANAQLIQLGLLVEYLYEGLEKQDIKISMEEFPEWAQARYKEIQAEAQQTMQENTEQMDEIKQTLKEESQNLFKDVASTTNDTGSEETAVEE